MTNITSSAPAPEARASEWAGPAQQRAVEEEWWTRQAEQRYDELRADSGRRYDRLVTAAGLDPEVDADLSARCRAVMAWLARYPEDVTEALAELLLVARTWATTHTLDVADWGMPSRDAFETRYQGWALRRAGFSDETASVHDAPRALGWPPIAEETAIDTDQPAGDNTVGTVLWSVSDGAVRLPVSRALQWADSLWTLINAAHDPGTLAATEPDTDPVQVARWVVDHIGELDQAAAAAAEQVEQIEPQQRVRWMRRDGDMVLASEFEIRSLAGALHSFAGAVLRLRNLLPAGVGDRHLQRVSDPSFAGDAMRWACALFDAAGAGLPPEAGSAPGPPRGRPLPHHLTSTRRPHMTDPQQSPGAAGDRVRLCRDEACPECGYPETFAEVDSSSPAPGAEAIGCSQCGWRQSPRPELAYGSDEYHRRAAIEREVNLGDLRGGFHRQLLDAIGIGGPDELPGHARKMLAWLAGWDHDVSEGMVQLFQVVRAEAVAHAVGMPFETAGAHAAPDRSENARIAQTCDTDVAGLIGLIRGLVTVVDVYAPDIDPGRMYWRQPPGRGHIYRDLPGGAGLVDLADELTPEALTVLAEVLAAEAAMEADEERGVAALRQEGVSCT